MSLSDPSELEPELEALLRRYVPDMDTRWSRASDADIAALEALAGAPLPGCYRWMMLRLGEGWDNIAYGSLQMAAHTVLACHRAGRFPPHDGMLCIAESTDPLQPQRRYYDISNAAHDDAPVYVTDPDTDAIDLEYESLREFIGVAAFGNHRVHPMPVRVEGLFAAPAGDNALDLLEPCIEELGFRAPLSTGSFCSIYDDGELALSSYRNPGHGVGAHLAPFMLGGPSEAALRRFLGVVITETELKARHLRWTPA